MKVQPFYQVRLAWRLLRDRRVPFGAKLIPLVALLYVLSPIDIIPDFILGLGQLDDVGVLLLALRAFERATPQHIVEEHRAVLEGRLAPDSVVEATDYTISHPDKR